LALPKAAVAQLEAFNGLSMDRSDDVLALGMIHSGMREVFAKVLIARPLAGAEQANFVRNRLTDEGLQSFGLNVRNDAGHNISLAA
jgi:hypothetical protein